MHAQVETGGRQRQDLVRLGLRDLRLELDRGHHSFPGASLESRIFIAWSATIRFWRRFSSCSTRSRWSSARVIPLDCRFQR